MKLDADQAARLRRIVDAARAAGIEGATSAFERRDDLGADLLTLSGKRRGEMVELTLAIQRPRDINWALNRLEELVQRERALS